MRYIRNRHRFKALNLLGGFAIILLWCIALSVVSGCTIRGFETKYPKAAEMIDGAQGVAGVAVDERLDLAPGTTKAVIDALEQAVEDHQENEALK